MLPTFSLYLKNEKRERDKYHFSISTSKSNKDQSFLTHRYVKDSGGTFTRNALQTLIT
jgi:hypothetical protein